MLAYQSQSPTSHRILLISLIQILLWNSDDVESMDPASWQLMQHLWESNTNLTVMCTLKSFGVYGTFVSDSVDLGASWAPPRNAKMKLKTELRSMFFDPDPRARRYRLLLVELEPLDESSTLFLTLNLLQDQGAMLGGEETSLNVMNSVSGGNPLYAVEVTKAAIKMLRDNEQGQQHLRTIPPQVWNKTFLDIASECRPERIEEIIIYRFDQLSPKSQLLLRVAAVAGLNDSPFTAKMLSFVLPDFCGARTQAELFNSSGCINKLLEDASERELRLAKAADGACQEVEIEDCVLEALRFITRESEFIRLQASPVPDLKSSEGDSSVHGSVHLEQSNKAMRSDQNKDSPPLLIIYDEHSQFEFTSTLVQATILSLSLHTQNSNFHEKVARYLESVAMANVQRPAVLTSWSQQNGSWSRVRTLSFVSGKGSSTATSSGKNSSSVSVAGHSRRGSFSISDSHNGSRKDLLCDMNSSSGSERGNNMLSSLPSQLESLMECKPISSLEW